MAIKTIDDTNLTAIADAIRAKGVEGTWKPSEMATAISNIKDSEGKQKYPYNEWWDEEELYKDLRPTTWMKLPSAKQFLLDNPSYVFCCYLSVDADPGWVDNSIEGVRLYLYDLNAEITSGYSNQNGEYTATKTLEYSNYGNTSVDTNLFNLHAEDMIYREDTGTYQMIMRIAHKTIQPFAGYSAGSWGNGSVNDVDIAGTPDLPFRSEYNTILPLGHMFSAAKFFNIENIRPTGDYVKDALFIGYYAYLKTAGILFRKNNFLYYSNNASYPHLIGIGDNSIRSLISPGCYPLFTYAVTTKPPEIQNCAAFFAVHQVKIGVRNSITSNNSVFINNVKPAYPYGHVCQICYRPTCSGSGTVNLASQLVLTPQTYVGMASNLDFDLIPTDIVWYNNTTEPASVKVQYFAGASLSTIYNICKFVQRLYREIRGWTNTTITITFMYEKFGYEDEPKFRALIDELSQDNITVTFRY